MSHHLDRLSLAFAYYLRNEVKHRFNVYSIRNGKPQIVAVSGRIEYDLRLHH